MPISLPECAIMAEEAMVCDVLHRFVSIPEQTYEQFLGTFIHPPKERQDEKSQPHSLPEQFCAPQGMDTRDWTEDSDIGSVVNLDESEQDQIVIDDGIKVGGYHCVDLAYPAKVQVDNYLDLSDLDTDQDNNEGLFTNHELLPGEAETETSFYQPSFTKCTELDFLTIPPNQHTAVTEEQRDDVQPFTLEEGFDYDHVALTPKFSESELKILETERNREIENTEHGQNHNL
ncbi:intraflagellar transport-associated protein [Rhinophrynus dorsalis]